MITCIFENSAKAIEAILSLHFPEGTILDVTAGQGTFWRLTSGRKITKGDLLNRDDRDYIGDARNLPFSDASFDLAVLDPPFKWVGRRYDRRYGQSHLKFNTETKVDRLYYSAIPELFRVARQGAIIKLVDGTDGHRHFPRLARIAEFIKALNGLEIHDSAIIVRKGIPNNLVPGKKQRFFRRPISHFLIYKFEGNPKRGIRF